MASRRRKRRPRSERKRNAHGACSYCGQHHNKKGRPSCRGHRPIVPSREKEKAT